MAQIVWKPKYELLPWQKKVSESKKRFKVVKGGRQIGKTIYANQWQATAACEMEPGEHMYCAPTQKQAAEISWHEYLDMLGTDIIAKVIERDHRIILKNKAQIILRGSDKLDLQRGKRYRTLVMEEAAFQKSAVFEKILRPTLIVYQSPALFISSPKKGWFTRMYDKYKNGLDPEYDCFHFTVYDNPTLSPAEIAKVRAQTSDSNFRTEYLAEELEYEGQVYVEFDPVVNTFGPDKWPDRKSYPCAVGIDWGLDDATGVVWLNFTPEGYCLVSREHLKGGWDVRRHAEVISRVAHDFNVKNEAYVMDQSAFRREGATGKSVADAFRDELGFSFQRSTKGSPDVGKDIIKRFLRGDGVTPWLYISNNCPEVILALNDWEHEQHEPDILAALRYGLCHAVQRGMTSLHDRIESLKSTYQRPDANVGDLELVRREKARLGASWGWDNEHGSPIGDLSEFN
jgi:hypothetical protein